MHHQTAYIIVNVSFISKKICLLPPNSFKWVPSDTVQTYSFRLLLTITLKTFVSKQIIPKQEGSVWGCLK